MLIFGVQSNLEHINSVFKRTFAKISVIISGLGLIVFFVLVMSSSFLDIGAFLSKEYKTVVGFPNKGSQVSIKAFWQTIEINDIRLKSVYKISEENASKEIKAVYLPHSKYVLELWISE